MHYISTLDRLIGRYEVDPGGLIQLRENGEKGFADLT
jgi:hypothetical protein